MSLARKNLCSPKASIVSKKQQPLESKKELGPFIVSI